MAARKAAPKSETTLFDRLRAEVKVPDPLRVTEDIVLECPTKFQLEASQRAATEEESNRVLLGEENYDKLNELFGPYAPHLWAEFHKQYIDHFFPTQSVPGN